MAIQIIKLVHYKHNMLETLSHVSVQGRLVCVREINKRLALLFALVSNVLGTQYIGAARTGPHNCVSHNKKVFMKDIYE